MKIQATFKAREEGTKSCAWPITVKRQPITLVLTVAFCLLVAMLVLVGWQGVHHLQRLEGRLEATVDNKWQNQLLTHEAFRISDENSRLTLLVFLLDDPTEIARLLEQRSRNTARISELVQAIEPRLRTDQERQLVAAIKATRQPYILSYQRALALLLTEHKRDEARQMMVNTVRPNLITYHDAWNAFDQYEADQIDQAIDQSKDEYSAQQRNFLLTVALATVTAGAIAIFTILRMRQEMAERRRAEQSLQDAHGRLEYVVTERTRELREKNAQMKEALEMARELQLALLPQKFPSIPGDAASRDSAVRFLTNYFPTGEVSGDFFSVFPVDDKSVGIFICDVMGHDVRAALVTSMIRVLVQEHVHEALEPGAMLGRINHGLVAILEQAGAAMYATGFYMVVDIQRRELRYSSAAHPSPFLISRATASAEPLRTEGIGGPALGIFKDATYGTARRPLSKGDLIMMFTDGIFEVEGSEGDMFSEKDLLATVHRKMDLPLKEFFDEVVGEVRAFSSSHAFDDDVCLIGVEVHSMD